MEHLELLGMTCDEAQAFCSQQGLSWAFIETGEIRDDRPVVYKVIQAIKLENQYQLIIAPFDVPVVFI